MSLISNKNNVKQQEEYSTTKEYSIYYTKETDSFEIKQQIIEGDDALATAIYTNSLFEIGWDTLYLTVRPNSIVDEKLQAYAAGYLEGAITTKRIYDYTVNTMEYFFGKERKATENVIEYLTEHKKFLDEFEEKHKNTDKDYEKTVINVFNQYKGMMKGYNDHTEYKKLDLIEFMTINSQGDISDVMYYKKPINFDEKSEEFLVKYHRENSHCSSIVKMKADYSDLFFSHNMWYSYTSQVRMMKTYTYNFQYSGKQKKLSITMSSYPGTINSNDDFNLLSNDLVVMETTNPVLNGELFENLNPRETLLTSYREVIANLISNSSKEWVENYVKYNSGTYNNQFIVLDLNKIDIENRRVQDEALMIVEQIPGDYEINDVTGYLRMGHWPSYNSPYSKKIREKSRYDHFTKKFPTLFPNFDYDMTPRATIFRRDADSIQNMTDFKKFMRYNQYQSDELSLGNPYFSIAGRADLIEDPVFMACYGNTDAKVGSIKDVKGKENKLIYVISGPTTDDQEPFDWRNSKACENKSHQGMPEVFDFDWVDYYTNPYEG